MNSSPTIGNLMLALAKAQGEMKNPEKHQTNAHFRSKYADITAGIDAVREPLSKHGIAFTQPTRMDGDVMILETILAHAESGEWISSEMPIIAFPARPQEVGAAMTYYRRFGLFAICGIAGDTPDDDGNAANEKTTPAPKKTSPPPKPPQMSEEDSAKARDGMVIAISEAKTREDLKKLLIETATERAAMWDDDKKIFIGAFRAAEDRIMAEREGKAE